MCISPVLDCAYIRDPSCVYVKQVLRARVLQAIVAWREDMLQLSERTRYLASSKTTAATTKQPQHNRMPCALRACMQSDGPQSFSQLVLASSGQLQAPGYEAITADSSTLLAPNTSSMMPVSSNISDDTLLAASSITPTSLHKGIRTIFPMAGSLLAAYELAPNDPVSDILESKARAAAGSDYPPAGFVGE